MNLIRRQIFPYFSCRWFVKSLKTAAIKPNFFTHLATFITPMLGKWLIVRPLNPSPSFHRSSSLSLGRNQKAFYLFYLLFLKLTAQWYTVPSSTHKHFSLSYCPASFSKSYYADFNHEVNRIQATRNHYSASVIIGMFITVGSCIISTLYISLCYLQSRQKCHTSDL